MTPKTAAIQDYLAPLVGRRLTAIEQHEFSWSFVFAEVATLTTEGPWRVLSAEAIIISSLDHGQKFGLPQPVDVLVQARQKILDEPVREIFARDGEGHLTVGFDSALVLEVFNLSTGYEAWQINKPQEPTLIAMGGGKLVFF